MYLIGLSNLCTHTHSTKISNLYIGPTGYVKNKCMFTVKASSLNQFYSTIVCEIPC